MAYRLYCEKSDVIGGLTPYGQGFFEPSVGHPAKGEEAPQGITMTDYILQKFQVARQTSAKCNPQFKRPHYALVGTQDGYYGDVAGTYIGKKMWNFMSTEVLGCTGNYSIAGSMTVTGISTPAQCSEFGSCAGVPASLNKYCTVDGMGHDTTGWENFLSVAFSAFFNTFNTTGIAAPSPASQPTP